MINSRKVSPVVQVVAIGIGAALFFVLGRFVAIPSPIPNTNISLQYAVLAVFAVLYGPIVGALTGFIGHILIDATWGIWISWEIASGVFGLILGALLIGNKIRDGEFGTKTIVRFNLGVIIAHAVAWILVAPLGDILIYSEPANKVFTQGAMAFGSNSIITCLLGTMILAIYARTRTSSGTLRQED
ncbi:energy-coupling factor transport system substrate-specific component [Trueperella bonasi]|uniref:Energy-coupling factor transport system substrate-specific component n=1 Tax=Trueperella bonasi TaxID=312286 RepID=A0ABT9NER6_9ACTO|nr:ECF-type riboflavin transporter substrate-binding protein [Trueperella bonasi]MDP9805867.1 energy-coupling factor transport system substrate-specific component [Trueperella bonasi]